MAYCVRVGLLMARSRMLWPGFWSSHHWLKCETYRKQLLYIGIFSNADDQGRILGLSTYLNGLIFPYKKISDDTIQEDLEWLSKEGMLAIYEHEDVPYYFVAKWEKYQSINHPQPSKLPVPPWGGIEWGKKKSASNRSAEEGVSKTGNDSGNGYGNGSGNGSRIDKTRLDKPKREYSDSFLEFWKHYPNKTGKWVTFLLWEELDPDLDKCLAQLAVMKKSKKWLNKDGAYVPNPSTWLKEGRMDDGLPDDGQVLGISDMPDHIIGGSAEEKRWLKKHGLDKR